MAHAQNQVELVTKAHCVRHKHLGPLDGQVLVVIGVAPAQANARVGKVLRVGQVAGAQRAAVGHDSGTVGRLGAAAGATYRHLVADRAGVQVAAYLALKTLAGEQIVVVIQHCGVVAVGVGKQARQVGVAVAVGVAIGQAQMPVIGKIPVQVTAPGAVRRFVKRPGRGQPLVAINGVEWFAQPVAEGAVGIG